MGGTGPANQISSNPPNNKVWLHVPCEHDLEDYTLHVVLAAHLQMFRKLNVKSVLMAHSL